MRPASRIPIILAALKERWEKDPDLRLVQLISNCIPAGQDGFFMEDDLLLVILEEEAGWGGRKHGIAK